MTTQTPEPADVRGEAPAGSGTNMGSGPTGPGGPTHPPGHPPPSPPPSPEPSHHGHLPPEPTRLRPSRPGDGPGSRSPSAGRDALHDPERPRPTPPPMPLPPPEFSLPQRKVQPRFEPGCDCPMCRPRWTG